MKNFSGATGCSGMPGYHGISVATAAYSGISVAITVVFPVKVAVAEQDMK